MSIMSSVFLMVVFSLAKVTLSTEVLASTEVCYSASDRTHALDYRFAAPYDGVINGVRLVHNSGGATCDSDYALTNWGCRINDGIIVNLVQLTDDTTGEGATMYPTTDTDGATIERTFDSCDCSVRRYKVTGYGYDSDELVLSSATGTTAYEVSTQTEYALQYCEAVCQISDGDNDGVSCATVYFLYQEIYPTEVLASDEVCYDAGDRTHALDYKFTAPFDGVVDGVRLVHNSGGASCTTAQDVTNWGCRVTSDGLNVNLVELTNDATGEGSTMYPTDDSDGATIERAFDSCDCSARRYTVDGYGYDADELVLSSDVSTYQVSQETEYVLQYCEAACQISDGDNYGVSCATVYLSYQDIILSN